MDHATGASDLNLMEARYIAQYFRVRESTVRTWAHRDKWKPYGTPRRQLWDLNEAKRFRGNGRTVIRNGETWAPVDAAEINNFSVSRCTVQHKYIGKFCDQVSIPDAPFPICIHHATETYMFIRDKIPSNEETLMDLIGDTLARRDHRTAKRENRGVVYYVKMGNVIKIGTTIKLRDRLSSYPPDHELLATEPGSYDLESVRLEQFAEDRIRGEWFRASPALLQHVAELNIDSQLDKSLTRDETTKSYRAHSAGRATTAEVARLVRAVRPWTLTAQLPSWIDVRT